VTVAPDGHGVKISFRGGDLFLNAQRYRLQVGAGGGECPLHDVDVVMLQPEYLMVSLPDTPDGYSDHLRFGRQLSQATLTWLRDVLKAAIARARDRTGDDSDVPDDLHKMMRS